MAVEVTPGTALAEALQNVVQPKLVELGWSTGGLDDSALSEYIILMLVNGKTQEQIASELSNDLLGLGPDDHAAIDFSQWLFNQVQNLQSKLNGSSSAPLSTQQQDSETSQSIRGDVNMGDVATAGQINSVPTGPRAMRNGTQNGRDKRLLGQLNKAMDRAGEAPLHRVRVTQGTSRVQSRSREPPKGPRGHLGNSQTSTTQKQFGSTSMHGGLHAGPAHPLLAMNAQQQMQLLAMYEEQARLMSQIMGPHHGQSFSAQSSSGPTFHPNPSSYNQRTQSTSRSLFERVEATKPKTSTLDAASVSRRQLPSQDKDMSDGHQDQTTIEQSSAMHVDGPQQTHTDPAETVCKFNLGCTKADCPFAHQSPAAPLGTTIDVHDICSFGAACKNRKCVARHPSPAKKTTHQAEQDCKFYPNCTNPHCPFRHPDMPPCRNGADCQVSGCKFAHSKIECRYNPCLNPSCPFKHSEGQKRGAFEDKVWTASNGDVKEHVSERKFVDDIAQEELILPGSGTSASILSSADIIA